NDVAEKSGHANSQMTEQATSFRAVTSKVLSDLSQLAVQFEVHGRSLAEAVDLIDQSNRRTEDTLPERRGSLDSLLATLDIRTEDLEQRLKRLSTLLDSSLEGATGRAREIAGLVAETATESTRALSEQYTAIRSISDEQREHLLESMRGLYSQ